MVDCPECKCDDTEEIKALKQKAQNRKSEIMARQSELLGTINSLTLELSELQEKNKEKLRPDVAICGSEIYPQSLNVIKTYRFGSKCGGVGK